MGPSRIGPLFEKLGAVPVRLLIAGRSCFCSVHGALADNAPSTRATGNHHRHTRSIGASRLAGDSAGWAVTNGCERHWQVLSARVGVKPRDNAAPGSRSASEGVAAITDWHGIAWNVARNSQEMVGGNRFRVARRYWPGCQRFHAQAGENPYGPFLLKGSPTGHHP